MNNRSIAWWLKQIGLSQYTRILESEYYGLEGLLNVTDGELKDAGIDDAGHRETILTQLSRQRQKLDPHASNTHMHSRADTQFYETPTVWQRKDLFRQSVLPRLQRSCSQLRPLDEAALGITNDNKCR
uniref:SAM domain-containing protein n=1 Tax=Tetraodon nigroviridis TaxID=99883 RepID=H3BZZ5_TETNG